MRIFVLLALVLSAPAHAYYGRHSTEAILRYQGVADLELPIAASDVEIKKSLDRQIQHLMGTFQAVSFRNEFGFPGALGERYEVRVTSVKPAAVRGRWLVAYDFKGEVVFQKEAFRNSATRRVPIRLPLAWDKIYGLGVVKGRNRCTDRDFNDADDFWYYWDSELPGCPLAENSTDVFRTYGKLERLPNTRTSYPEYHRLYGDNGNGKNLDIALFIGYIRDQDVTSTRPNRHDEAVRAFHFIDRELRDRGFTLIERADHFRLLSGGKLGEGINYLRRYEAPIDSAGGELKARITLLLADTDIDSKDETFHRYLVPAMRQADVLVYDGHSNLGRNFDLNVLPRIDFDQSKYQIFFFNGCSTYPYLNGMYFRAKHGTKNLDVITAGLPAFASTSGPNVMAFLSRFLTGETLSYQKILSDLEASNEDAGTYLVGVKGDEDNGWIPLGVTEAH